MGVNLVLGHPMGVQEEASNVQNGEPTMTVKELLKHLENAPSDAKVCLETDDSGMNVRTVTLTQYQTGSTQFVTLYNYDANIPKDEIEL